MFRSFVLSTTVLLLVVCSGLTVSVQAAGENTEKEKKKPVTTGDPYVPQEELELSITAFTKDELLVEAKGWQMLLRAKAVEIAKAEIEVKRRSRDSEKDGESQESVQEAKEKPEQSEVSKRETKEGLLAAVNRLREERTLIIDNFKAVLAELASKADVNDSTTQAILQDYNLYIKSVQGIHLDIKDTTSSWITVKGWLLSEEGGWRFAVNILKFVGILFAAWLLSRIVSRLINRALGYAGNVSNLLRNFLVGAARWTIMFIGIIMALAAMEVSVAPLLAMVGAAGFIIALALQDSLSNFASGIMILFFRPFDVGDFIEAGGVDGSVATMNLVSTTIRTADNKKMVVPNNKIWQDVITNATGVSTRRVDLVFGIGYEDDIDRAQEVLEKIVADHPKILKDPEPNIRLHVLADSSVNFICRPWSRAADYWDVYWDVTREVKLKFDEAGISIPFPQQDVHLHVESDGKTAS